MSARRERGQGSQTQSTEAPNGMNLSDFKEKSIPDLNQIARDLNVQNLGGLRKQELIFKILQSQAEKDGLIFAAGVLEVLPDGFGFLRAQDYNYLPGPDDIYVSPSQIRRFNLRTDAFCRIKSDEEAFADKGQGHNAEIPFRIMLTEQALQERDGCRFVYRISRDDKRIVSFFKLFQECFLQRAVRTGRAVEKDDVRSGKYKKGRCDEERRKSGTDSVCATHVFQRGLLLPHRRPRRHVP